MIIVEFTGAASRCQSQQGRVILAACAGTFLVINGEVSNPWSRIELSNALQGTLLDAVASNLAGVHTGFFVSRDWENLLTHYVLIA